MPEITWDDITAQNPDIVAPGTATQVNISEKYAADPTTFIRALMHACYKAQSLKNETKAPEEQVFTYAEPSFGNPSVDPITKNFSSLSSYRLNCTVYYIEA